MTAQRPATITATPYRAVDAPSSFVINLGSSTTPMAFAQPALPELKRFTFFVSRRLEDGRERFRLHMGHFATLAEAEEWLSVVRDVYPGAWASEAPGKRLRESAAAAHPDANKSESLVGSAPARRVGVPPTLHASVKGTAPARAASVTVHRPASTGTTVAPASRSGAMTAKPQAAAARGSASKNTLFSGSNVREVLKSLDDHAPGQTRAQPSPAAAYSSGARARPAQDATLSDTQVLRILESRADGRKDAQEQAGAAGIQLLSADDTGTRQALRDAVRNNAPVSFAVQLQWSTQPIDPNKTPPLAIFNAYTLYNVEGSRDRRKWYGLRLGFFSDAISAKQVASYVRSDFASVAVIPVSAQERNWATEKYSGKSAGGFTAQSRHRSRPAEEITLFDDRSEGMTRPKPAPAAGARPAAPLKPFAAKAGRKAAPPRPNKTGGKVVQAREKRAPQTLEETLEILGASELQIADGRSGDYLSDSGVRHLQMQQVRQKNSPFAKLLDRLGEKARKF